MPDASINERPLCGRSKQANERLVEARQSRIKLGLISARPYISAQCSAVGMRVAQQVRQLNAVSATVAI